MSFFVSKSLKDRVDESCLIEEVITSKPDRRREFVVTFKNQDQESFLQIEDLKFNKDKTASFSCRSNLTAVENVIFDMASGEITFKNKKAIVEDVKIVEINRVDNDIYRMKVNCVLKLDRCIQ